MSILQDPMEEDLQDKLLKIRAKFKVLSNQLRVQQEFDETRRKISQQMSFWLEQTQYLCTVCKNIYEIELSSLIYRTIVLIYILIMFFVAYGSGKQIQNISKYSTNDKFLSFIFRKHTLYKEIPFINK